MTMTASLGAFKTDKGNPLRIMIVDDSAVVRGLVSRWIEEEEGMEIVARHSNGQLAVNDMTKSNPDIVLLDVEMPIMDGLAALPEILKAKPGVKVIMASTLTRRNAEVSLKALSLGAVDYIPKPESNSGITTSTSFRNDLVAKIKAVGGRANFRFAQQNSTASPSLSSASVSSASGTSTSTQTYTPSQTSVRSQMIAAAHGNKGSYTLRSFSRVSPRILAVGSSTGGPQALMAVFKEIAQDVAHIPVVITQHMPATFTTILAEHLTKIFGRLVKEGEEGEEVQNGGVYVAPGGKHMILQERMGKVTITLDNGPEVNFCKPAVDPMFDSVCKIYKGSILAVVLTGMGQDGAHGAGQIADAGGSVIAQDEASSVVWGMPGATASMGNASAVLPLNQIGMKIKSLVNGGVR